MAVISFMIQAPCLIFENKAKKANNTKSPKACTIKYYGFIIYSKWADFVVS